MLTCRLVVETVYTIVAFQLIRVDWGLESSLERGR